MRGWWLIALLLAVDVVAAVFALTLDAAHPAGWCMLAAAALTLVLYVMVIKPVEAIEDGLNLLRAQDYSSRLRTVGQHNADTIITLFNDLMDRLRNERLSLEEKNLFLNKLIESSAQGIVIMDLDMKGRQLNPAARSMLAEIDIPALAPREATTVRSARGEVFRVLRQSFMDRGAQRTFYIIESLTAELHKAERDTYSRVIRTISHEVNNSMGGVDSVLQFIGETADGDMAGIIDSCRDRMRNLSRFISGYASLVKLPEPEMTRTDLAASLAPLRQFIDRMCADAGITAVYDLGECLPVMIDPAMWQQCVVNIVKNSVESISSSHRADGQVTIRACGTTLRVTDNGPGISPADAGSLFSPFFTTKAGGQGLGLMLVHEILDRHGCGFSLSTDPLTGLTDFIIKFPQ